MSNKNFLFLLGGHDLEMLEIAGMLREHGMAFIDLKLKWGAKLSAYQSFFANDKTTVGIELIRDIAPPQNYIDIDHHNDRSNEPASIEQVAALLGIALTRYQQLVAANDKGYIPAMLAMGATEEEIWSIRLKDRQAQGATEELEKAAEIALQQAVYAGNILLVKAESTPFSPITDRIWQVPQKIVYTNAELTYFGKGIDILQTHFASLIDERKAYSGGGGQGFFGLANGSFHQTEIEKIIFEIVELLGNPQCIVVNDRLQKMII